LAYAVIRRTRYNGSGFSDTYFRELYTAPKILRIEELYERLVDVARQRVRSGELTERGLSRLCGVSQPHIHNVLKQIRTLSPASADRLMEALEITLPELLWRSPEESGASFRIVPMVRNRIGPGMDTTLSAFRGCMPFPTRLVEGLVDPVVAQLGPDLVLPSPVSPNDLVLLDQNRDVRERPRGESCWVVAEPAGFRVRYVRWGGTRLYLANEATIHEPKLWSSVSLQGKEITEIVRARIVWIGRELAGV
jgi:hypothetical protein